MTKKEIQESTFTHEEMEEYFQFTTDMLCVASTDGYFKKLNKPWETTLGYTMDELMKDPLASFIHPEDVEPTHQEITKQIQGHYTRAFVNRYRHKDGSYRWFEWQASPAKDGKYLFAMARDITKDKRQESRQRLYNEVLLSLSHPSKLQETISKILQCIQKETGLDAVAIRYQNQEDFTYFLQSGFDVEFLQAENSLIARDQKGDVCRDKNGNVCLECTCGLVISGKTDPNNPLFTPGGSGWTNDARILLDIPAEQEPRLNPRNRCIHAGYNSVALIPIRAQDQIVGILQLNDRRKNRFTLQDVEFYEMIGTNIGVALTRKQEVETIARQKTRIEALYQGLRDAVFIADHKTGIILDCNDAACILMMRDKKNLVGLHQRELHPPMEHTGEFSRTFNKHTDEGGGRIQEAQILRSDGCTRDVSIHASIIDIDGAQVMQGVFRDITERKQTEQLVINQQKALAHSEKLASIGMLAAGVAHEINNPLMIISGNILILKQAIEKNKSIEDQFKYLEKQSKAVDRCVAIVNGLRTYARADTEILEEIDIHQVIHETLGLCGYIYKKENIEIQLSLECVEPIVRCNQGKMQQVLMNLLSNAKDALAGIKNGQIRIETSGKDALVTLKISDNGCGIEEKHHKSIFDPFFTTKPAGKGTGLGLSISHGIIASFGGSIQCESEKGMGTLFLILLPTAKVALKALEAASGQEAAVKVSGRVLVVDDEQEIREILEGYLRGAGMEVTHACDGLEALERLKKGSFDYVISDIKMPRMDGPTLLLEARKLGFYTKTRFILITGGIVTDYTKEQREQIRKNAHAYIRKPFDREMVIRSLKQLEENHPVQRRKTENHRN